MGTGLAVDETQPALIKDAATIDAIRAFFIFIFVFILIFI
jgi:hypothetical protein